MVAELHGIACSVPGCGRLRRLPAQLAERGRGVRDAEKLANLAARGHRAAHATGCRFHVELRVSGERQGDEKNGKAHVGLRQKCTGLFRFPDNGRQPVSAFAALFFTMKDMDEMQRYDPHEIEPRWQARWDADASLYAAEPPASGKPKFYCLEMLPYPSGQLHIGHVRNYSIGDALARFMTMRGYNVLHPMGWDAFGLPAENAALKNNTPPREWTFSNIASMKKQFARLGMAFDWSNEVTTCLPDYYRWNQWFFLKMYEQGLAYRKSSKVNWCPLCATVLANEQVVGGCCWRHEEQLVEQRELEQWFLRITKYADELLAGLDAMPGWPEKVRTMQRNWIGRSPGAEVTFAVHGCTDGMTVKVFTTRVDTIFGATSIQLAPEHALVKHFAAMDNDVDRALARSVEEMTAQQKAAKETGDIGNIEKHGVSTGRSAVNPFTGETMPIWVANYILADYGTGAIMSVPAHDERDFEFAQKYGLPVKRVIAPALSGGAGGR